MILKVFALLTILTLLTVLTQIITIAFNTNTDQKFTSESTFSSFVCYRKVKTIQIREQEKSEQQTID